MKGRGQMKIKSLKYSLKNSILGPVQTTISLAPWQCDFVCACVCVSVPAGEKGRCNELKLELEVTTAKAGLSERGRGKRET